MSKQQYEAGLDLGKKGKTKDSAEAKVRKIDVMFRPPPRSLRNPGDVFHPQLLAL